MSDPRDEFEREFPIPAHCKRCGTGYTATEYNAWAAHAHLEHWKGWSAARSPKILVDAIERALAGAPTPTDSAKAWRDLFSTYLHEATLSSAFGPCWMKFYQAACALHEDQTKEAPT